MHGHGDLDAAGYLSTEVAARYALLNVRDAVADDGPLPDRMEMLRLAEVWGNLAIMLAVTGPIYLPQAIRS